MFTEVLCIRRRLAVQWASLLGHHNVLIMMIYYSAYYNIPTTRNDTQGEDLSSLMAYFCHQLWWWWGEGEVGEQRGGWHSSVSCPVSICPARKKLNWFLQGNKAKRGEEKISSLVPDIPSPSSNSNPTYFTSNTPSAPYHGV